MEAKQQSSGARDQEIRAALDQHWAASDANDFETEHRIYHEDAVLEYPQSGERIRGRRNIQITRANQPSNKRFAVRRWMSIGRRPMPTILKRSTVSILRTRCWNTLSQGSELADGATY